MPTATWSQARGTLGVPEGASGPRSRPMTRSRKAPPEGPSPEEDDPYDLGDLELAPWPAKPSTPSSWEPEIDHGFGDLAALPASKPANDVAPQRPASEPDGEHDRNLDDAAHGPSIELDLPSDDPVVIRPRLSTQPRTPSLPRTSSQPHGSSRPARAATSGSGRADDGTRAGRMLADFGEPPQGLVASAGYVIRVAKRIRVLVRERHAIEQRAAQERGEHQVALAALGRALARDAVVLGHAALEDPRARVQALEAELAQRTQAALGARAQEQAALSSLATQRATLAAELAPFLTVEREALAAHARSEAELKRKRAHEQRIDIELRALARASTPPPEDRRPRLEREQRERAADVAAARASHDECARVLGLARRELILRRGQLDALTQEQDRRAVQARSLDARLELDVTRARDALDADLSALAQAARQLGLTSASSDEVARVTRCETRLDELASRLSAYDRALTLYDMGGLIKGALVWSSLVLAGVLATWLLTTPA